ncbi:MAG: hypothetical protein SF339_28010 [Blastocatellia bacterium]|nr:hypothetical protein [Blastocatellia bacterium]
MMFRAACVVFVSLFAAPELRIFAAEPMPVIELRDAALVSLPGGLDSTGRVHSIDSNSPVEWDDDGRIFLFTSSQQPFRASGANLFDLSWPALPVAIQPRADVRGGLWIEATHRAADGTLYGWYHNEPPGVCGNSSRLTAPRIGALRSRDNGYSWDNLGIILEAPADSLNCSTANYYFAGGNGDFSVVLDPNGEYLYFFISTYHRQVGEQGVAVARMKYEDRDTPVGNAWKWRDGAWLEPGLGGRPTITFPALIDWHVPFANAYWGPSVHFNTNLDAYVMLLNHASDRNWTQEGIYISYNRDLSNPTGWTLPERLPIYGQLGWYPQVIGLDGGETDKVAGHVARLFISGHSSHEIVFHRADGEEERRFIAPIRLPFRKRIEIFREPRPE